MTGEGPDLHLSLSPAWSLFSGTAAAAAAAKSLQLCLTLCDLIDGSPPGSSIPGTLQARILEWVAISFSNACMHALSLQLCPTLCDPMGSSPPGSSVHRILQARTLEWVATAFSRDGDPEAGVRGSCSLQVRGERFPVCPGKRGSWCWGVGRLWAPWSWGQVPGDSPSLCLLPEPWFRNCSGPPCHYRASSVTLADFSVVTVIFPMGGTRQGWELAWVPIGP